MSDPREQLKNAVGGYSNPSPNDSTDVSLDEKRKNRSYNPADEAEKAMISSKLNEDAGRYLKGPGPV